MSASLTERLNELQKLLSEEVAAIESSIDPATEEFESKIIKPKKMDISISMVTLVWVPYHLDDRGGIKPA